MSMTIEQQAREEMVRLGASFFQRGYATGSAGNLSLMLPDGALLATPTGSCLGELQADRLSKVSLNGDWLSGDKPSKEISFHRALYLNNPECKAVVHLHCTYLTALSCLQGAGRRQRHQTVHPLCGDARRQGAGGALLPARRRKAGAGSGPPGADPPRLFAGQPRAGGDG